LTTILQFIGQTVSIALKSGQRRALARATRALPIAKSPRVKKIAKKEKNVQTPLEVGYANLLVDRFFVSGRGDSWRAQPKGS
jgi:hypothetical protein